MEEVLGKQTTLILVPENLKGNVMEFIDRSGMTWENNYEILRNKL
jgi:hypothetical protein